jgi:hypothetical protein
VDPRNFPTPERPSIKGEVLNEAKRSAEHDLLFKDLAQISDVVDTCVAARVTDPATKHSAGVEPP